MACFLDLKKGKNFKVKCNEPCLLCLKDAWQQRQTSVTHSLLTEIESLIEAEREISLGT